nr:tetratricopeptide repeat protein [uncultured Methanospirillum sp.]
MNGKISSIRWVFILLLTTIVISTGVADPGGDFYASGDYSASIGWYEQALRGSTGPDQAPILNNIGTGYMALHQQEKAFDYYSRAVAVDPTYDRGWINLGVTQEKLGRPDDALQSYDRVSGSNPEIYAEAMVKKGTLLSVQGKLADALFAFHQGETGARGQVLVDLYTGIGAIEFMQKNLGAAETDFQKAINEDPQGAALAWTNLGVLKISKGEYADAKRAFETAILHDKARKTNAAVYLKKIQAMGVA